MAVDKGFHPPDRTEDVAFDAMTNNLHDEVSELHTAWRENKLRELCDKADKMHALGIEPLTCLEEELADIIIRTCDTAGALKVNLGSAVYRKFLFNASRSHRHGNRRS